MQVCWDEQKTLPKMNMKDDPERWNGSHKWLDGGAGTDTSITISVTPTEMTNTGVLTSLPLLLAKPLKTNKKQKAKHTLKKQGALTAVTAE